MIVFNLLCGVGVKVSETAKAEALERSVELKSIH